MKFLFLLIAVCAFAGLVLWTYSHVQLPTLSFTASNNSLSANASASLRATSPAQFDENGTIVLDTSDGPNGVPYILYTRYSASGSASIATKRLVFAGETGCQASALPCATRPPKFPVAAGEQVHVTGVVDAQNVFVESFQTTSAPIQAN